MCKSRIEAARSYLGAYRALRAQKWSHLRDRWDSLAIHERLVLVHPDWIREVGGTPADVVAVQGPRAFTIDSGSRICSSSRIWGYVCPLDCACQYDHLWPYALGGPTKPGNAVPLCRHHNSLKGVDIHAYPWEESPFPGELWLDSQVALIADFLKRGRGSDIGA